jgi:nucleotide sugar dehydrogenase
MNVAVVGAGKMGLPLACQFAHNGASVIACDINPVVVDAINHGRCLVDEPGVPALLAAAVKAGCLTATTDTANAVSGSDVVVVIVPAVLTPDQHIDLTLLDSVSADIARGVHPGLMISYETTVFVGCTRTHLRPILETSGLQAGRDFDLVFSPERVKSQSVLRHLAKHPKVIGGFDDRAADRGVDFYQTFLGAPTIRLGSLEEAELCKLVGMIYRDVNIALANELARYAESVGINVHEVIAAANTDGEAALLQPGIGVGGHCTPVYPHFVIQDAITRHTPVTLAERARRINDEQAAYVLRRVETEWAQLRGKDVLILGLGFRPRVKEHIYSTAYLLRDGLQLLGANVTLHDPLYSPDEIRAHGFVPGSWHEDSPPAVLILNTAHPEYLELDFTALARRGVQLLVDGRHAWSTSAVRAAGLMYIGVGQASETPRTVRQPMYASHGVCNQQHAHVPGA